MKAPKGRPIGFRTSKLPRQLVALDGDRLLVNEPTAKEVYSKAKVVGVALPFVRFKFGLVDYEDQVTA